MTAASGHTATRSFCPTCGSTVFGNTTQLPDLAVFAAGTLDDPSWYKPAMNIFVADAQPWEPLDPALPRFPAMPDMS